MPGLPDAEDSAVETNLDMPIRREKIMKKLLICSVNELQLLVHICGMNVQPSTLFLRYSFTQKRDEGRVEKRNLFVPL